MVASDKQYGANYALNGYIAICHPICFVPIVKYMRRRDACHFTTTNSSTEIGSHLA